MGFSGNEILKRYVFRFLRHEDTFSNYLNVVASSFQMIGEATESSPRYCLVLVTESGTEIDDLNCLEIFNRRMRLSK